MNDATQFFNTTAGGGGGYEIERSLRFNSSDSTYLSRTPASAGNRRTFTWSGWVKVAKQEAYPNQKGLFFAGTSGSNLFRIMFSDPGHLRIDNDANGSNQTALQTTQVFRDFSAWMHILLAIDTTQATASNRYKLYVNGAQITTFSTATYQAQNTDTLVNSTNAHSMGALINQTPPYYFDGYLADIHFIDGQALDPTSFGEFDTNGVWQPKAYAGSYGTNGFHLPFSDNSTAAALGTDTSGNGNTWTVNNISASTGGPYPIASASGALPIYNTTDPYGTTKGTGTRTDANASSLVLAIPMDGANNGTTFTDESATIKGSGVAKTITTNGDAKTSTTESKYYGSSGYFDGAGDYLSIPDSDDWDISGDYTIEFWANMPAQSTASYTIGYCTNIAIGATNGFALGHYLGTLVLLLNGSVIQSSAVLLTNTWQHIALVISGASVKGYVDGVQVLSTTSATTTTSTPLIIGNWFGNLDPNRYFNGYIQDFRIYKGVAKYTSNFIPPTNTQNSAVAVACDSLVDTPTNYGTDTGAGGEVRGNYATLNPLAKGGTHSLSNGNLDFSLPGTSGSTSTFGTIGVSSGKWYWELTVTGTTTYYPGIGVETNPVPSVQSGSNTTGYTYLNTGEKLINSTLTAYGASFTTGDVVSVALDMDAGTLTCYKNGVSQGQLVSGITGAAFPVIIGQISGSGSLNFGQRPFAYAAPTGYKALCTQNLPDPTIADGSTVMDVALYTGNGTSQTISGLGFSPDLVWIKARDAAYWHELTDSVRGAGETLFSNATDAELTINTLTAFNADGFTVAVQTGFNGTNESPRSYAAWTWDAGSSTVTNTDGSITSQVRANPSAGFSVVSGAGTYFSGTLGHGLGVAPEFILAKDRDTTAQWYVYHKGLTNPNNYHLILNSNLGEVDFGSNLWNVTSTTFASDQGITGRAGIFYCFAPVEGYSAFGSYTGNGSADGPFVYTGFRPKFFMLKSATSAESWLTIDAARPSYNAINQYLYPDLAIAEGSAVDVADFTSNGVKIRFNAANVNTSGATYIYAAFAENPFKTSRAR